jgi:hypothetical protein
VAEQEPAAGEGWLGEYDVGGFGAVRRHDRVVLGPARLHEDVLEIEGDRLRALQGHPFREGFLPVLPVVEVGLIRQGQVLGSGGGHDLGEATAGDEPDPVSPLHEVAGDGQERRDVPVYGHGRDDDGRHRSPSSVASRYIGYRLELFTTMRQ